MVLGRYATTLLLSSFVTFGLLWTMQALIGVEGELDESEKTRVIEFVRLKRDTRAEAKEREIPDRKAPEREPPPPALDLSENLRPDAGSAGFAPTFEAESELAGGAGLGGLAAADTDAVPLVRVNPEYPQRAAQRGIEGWVEVEFTISKTGTVREPRVVAYEPSNIFNEAALRAIKRWKYNPRVEAGEPIEQHGILVRLAFELED